jgi:hypothetical protein
MNGPAGYQKLCDRKSFILDAIDSTFAARRVSMDDALLLKDKIRFMIEIGESHFREFKSCLDGPRSQKKPRELKSEVGRQ